MQIEIFYRSVWRLWIDNWLIGCFYAKFIGHHINFMTPVYFARKKWWHKKMSHKLIQWREHGQIPSAPRNSVQIVVVTHPHRLSLCYFGCLHGFYQAVSLEIWVFWMFMLDFYPHFRSHSCWHIGLNKMLFLFLNVVYF